MHTSKQKADLEERRTGLQRRINQFREVQIAYSPCIATLLPVGGGQAENEVRNQVHPEDIPLHLPSSLPASLRHSITTLADKERRLREAQCDDALSDIRRQRRILTGLVQFKRLNLAGQGNKPNTRIRTLYNRIQLKITRAHQKYSTAREALLVLSPDGNWVHRLKVLHKDDIKGPGKEEGESSGRYVMSWIWMVPRAETEGTEALEGEELDESLRVEWMKSKARLERWEEEVLLVQEEMRRSIVYLRWESDWWLKRQLDVPSKSASIVHGINAYASKQSALLGALAQRFSDTWVPILRSLGLTPQWSDRTPVLVVPQPLQDTREDDENYDHVTSLSGGWLSDEDDVEDFDADDADDMYDFELDDL